MVMTKQTKKKKPSSKTKNLMVRLNAEHYAEADALRRAFGWTWKTMVTSALGAMVYVNSEEGRKNERN
jgi:hypothetical protein